MSETPLAAEFRAWFLRDLTVRDGMCLGCAAQVTTVGPRGGRTWKFEGHTPDCLLMRVYHALNEERTR